MLNTELEITRESWDKLYDFLSSEEREDAIDYLGSLTEKQAQGIIGYIEERKYDLTAVPAVTLNTVLSDISGLAYNKNGFTPATKKYQPID